MKFLRAKGQQWRLWWKNEGLTSLFPGIWFVTLASALIGLGFFVYGTVIKSTGAAHLGKVLMLPFGSLVALVFLISVLHDLLNVTWKPTKKADKNEHHD